MNKDRQKDGCYLKVRNTISLHFGCQMNEHDSETIAGMLQEEGLPAGRCRKTSRTSRSSTHAASGKTRTSVFSARWDSSKRSRKRIRNTIGMRLRLYDAAAAHHRYHQEQNIRGWTSSSGRITCISSRNFWNKLYHEKQKHFRYGGLSGSVRS